MGRTVGLFMGCVDGIIVGSCVGTRAGDIVVCIQTPDLHCPYGTLLQGLPSGRTNCAPQVPVALLQEPPK